MALIKCEECGHEISDKASSCPNCGCPLVTAESDKKEVLNKSVEIISKLVEKVKALSPQKLAIFAAIFIIFMIVICIPSGVEKDKAVLEDYLLEPSSLTIYEAYTNDNYGDDGRATLFYFGAKINPEE